MLWKREYIFYSNFPNLITQKISASLLLIYMIETLNITKREKERESHGGESSESQGSLLQLSSSGISSSLYALSRTWKDMRNFLGRYGCKEKKGVRERNRDREIENRYKAARGWTRGTKRATAYVIATLSFSFSLFLSLQHTHTAKALLFSPRVYFHSCYCYCCCSTPFVRTGVYTCTSWFAASVSAGR